MNEAQKAVNIKVTVNGIDRVQTIVDSIGSAVDDIKDLTDILAKACNDVYVIINPQEDGQKADEVKPVNFKLLNDLVEEDPNLTYGEVIGALEMCHIPMTYAVRRLGVCCGVLTE